jgi:protein SCO1/2
MKRLHMFCLVGLVLSLFLLGCGGGGDTAKTVGDKQYDVRGKVMGLNPDKSALTLDHEDIPGLMKAMEMEFLVEDQKILAGIKVGDQVQGQLKKMESGLVITRLEKR